MLSERGVGNSALLAAMVMLFALSALPRARTVGGAGAWLVAGRIVSAGTVLLVSMPEFVVAGALVLLFLR